MYFEKEQRLIQLLYPRDLGSMCGAYVAVKVTNSDHLLSVYCSYIQFAYQ